MEENKIKFHCIKNEDLNDYHVDGALFGITPRGYIVMNFFSEIYPIPEIIIYEIENGILGNEIEKIVKEGVIRKIECSILMDLFSAKNIVSGLTETINALEKLQNSPKNSRQV